MEESMSFLGDLADRIRKTFNRKNTPKLDNATYRGNNYNRDLILESNLNKHNMKYFENPWKYNEFCKEYFKEPGNFESQYDYVDIISQMQANGAMDEFKSYLSYIQNNSNLYYPSAVHGIDHTSRVTFLAEMLCSLDNLSSHDKNLIMVAAELHDIGREDDKKRFDHGFAGKEKIEKYGLLRNFSSKDKNIIEFAVASHSLEPEQIEEQLKKVPKRHRTEYKRVLDYLQDADKLDRARINYEKNIGAGVDPNRLANPTAKRLLKVAHQNFYEFYNVMNYENEISKTDQLGISMKSYFDEVRSYGYNISFEDFQNIVAELQPGTLQKLKSEGNLNKIFSYSNFLANRVPETFDDRIKVNRVEPDKLFDEINKDKSTPIIKDVFDEDYMTYYNLKKNDPEAFNLLCYVDVDVATRDIIGLAKVVQIEDLAKFHSSGWQFRMNDIFRLGSKITPEQYQTIINNGKFEDLVSSKYVKPEIVNGVRANLANQGINRTNSFNSTRYF
jgi:putative nucleotidyltransferase with HDIG domain